MAQSWGKDCSLSAARGSWTRFICVTALLSGSFAFLNVRGRPESLPPHQPLGTFPLLLTNSFGRDVPIPSDVASVLGEGEFVERVYQTGAQPLVDLFVAYFPTQRTGSTIHSPQNCLPGAGWTPIEFNRIPLPRPGGGSISVNRYVIAKGLDRQLVLYWYQSHGRVVASEYAAKFYLVADSIRMNRSDGALVRVVTSINSGETETVAENRAVAFTQSVLPLLDSYVPR
jgi:EpsI family protein